MEANEFRDFLEDKTLNHLLNPEYYKEIKLRERVREHFIGHRGAFREAFKKVRRIFPEKYDSQLETIPIGLVLLGCPNAVALQSPSGQPVLFLI